MKVQSTFILLVALRSMMVGWFASTYVLFILSHGYSLLEVNLINTVFMVAVFIIDPWTGNLADRFGQKRVYIWGLAVWTIATLYYSTTTTFVQFALAELLAAVGSALISEALESWIRNQSDTRTFQAAISKAEVLGILGTMISSFGGGYIAQIAGLNMPWIFSALTGVIASVVSFFTLKGLPEWKPVEGTRTPTVFEVATIIRKKPIVVSLAVMSMLTFLVLQPVNMFWAPIMRNYVDQTTLGFVSSLIFGTYAVGSWLGGKISDGFRALSFTILIMGICILIAATSGFYPIIIVSFVLHEIPRGAWKPVFSTVVHNNIDNHYRSTAASILSSVRMLGSAIGLVVSGIVSLFIGPQEVWIVSAVTMMVIGIYLKRKY